MRNHLITKLPLVFSEAIPRLCNRHNCLKDRVPGTNHCQEHQPKPKKRKFRPENKTRLIERIELGRSTLYFISCVGASAVKIGRTGNIKLRLMGLQASNPLELKIIKHFKCPSFYEEKVHLLLDEHRIRGEWFRMNEYVMNFIEKLGHANQEKILKQMFYERDI